MQPTQLECPEAPVKGYTHHLVPKSGVMVCQYCKKTAKEITSGKNAR
ncbi:hypothetical protein SEA_WEASELS2_285 [Rhodococcus phage Weasels2]|uniref:Uncharacterized protein n=1 Tax=Rhodococcus phage Weasels2 TaxID=1897437 RepID=A0A1I9SAQ7_9CAUD|nr:hypothetical protein FDH04_gp131 [Rhodococcus phage Weasels2]AOZ63863.1 hypothetical protein SEA_WEASELS2_285 [Rhodococcus phage Weasels2]